MALVNGAVSLIFSLSPFVVCIKGLLIFSFKVNLISIHFTNRAYELQEFLVGFWGLVIISPEILFIHLFLFKL